MSDFFGGLTGGNIRFTDARINGDGPLPTSLSGPEGIYGDADGKYNFNDSLLSGLAPYAYGQGRMGSDRNYQQIPNKKQFSVPPLFLPEPEHNTDNLFQVSHQIDMGDIAFILNVQHKQFLLMPGPHKAVIPNEDHTLPQWNVFCNICTVNYILAGLHNYAVHCAQNQHMPSLKQAWYRLFVCLKIEGHLNHIIQQYQRETTTPETANALLALRCQMMLRQIVRQNIIPIGICSMSEKQGGQHEVGMKPVQAACNFFTTLTVDGQNRDLVNVWRALDIDAGDLLTFRLEFIAEKQRKHQYVLNHYYKDTVTKVITMHSDSIGRIQLMPAVYKIDAAHKKGNNFKHHLKETHLQSLLRNAGFALDKTLTMLHAFATDSRYSGYWHIGQTYTKKQCFTTLYVPTNDMEMTKGQLLQINFAPVWKGAIPGVRKRTDKEISYCLEYLLQSLLFSTILNESVFVDAAVAAEAPPRLVTDAPSSNLFRSVQKSNVQPIVVLESRSLQTAVQSSSSAEKSLSSMPAPVVPGVRNVAQNTTAMDTTGTSSTVASDTTSSSVRGSSGQNSSAQQSSGASKTTTKSIGTEIADASASSSSKTSSASHKFAVSYCKFVHYVIANLFTTAYKT